MTRTGLDTFSVLDVLMLSEGALTCRDAFLSLLTLESSEILYNLHSHKNV